MKAKCKKCYYLDRDMLSNTKEKNNWHFCGLHGRAEVDPDGEQRNLDRRGGCGFFTIEGKQLNFLEELFNNI